MCFFSRRRSYRVRADEELRDDRRGRGGRLRHRHRHGPHRKVQPKPAVPIPAQ